MRGNKRQGNKVADDRGLGKRDLRNGSIQIKDFESFDHKKQLKKPHKKRKDNGRSLLAVGYLMDIFLPTSPKDIHEKCHNNIPNNPGSCHVSTAVVTIII